MSQPRKLARVAILKRNHDPIGGESGQSLQRIGGKARLSLFSVGDYRRAGGFKALHGIQHRIVVGSVECFCWNISCGMTRDRTK